MKPHPYASFLHLVKLPGRYIGGEFGQIVKEKARFRVALAFPDVYELGQSYLGLSILYNRLNRMEDVAAERVFAPWPDMEEELRRRSLPLLSLETARPLREFDMVGFSLTYELGATNVLMMLDLGGIPFRSEDRTSSDPLIIGGGPMTLHPEPLAPFFDLFLLGDGEEAFPSLVSEIMSLRDEPRQSLLKRLSERPEIYVPSEVRTADVRGRLCAVDFGPSRPAARRAVVQSIPLPDVFPVSNVEASFDRCSVEVARGCACGCRFCQAGMTYRPVREQRGRDIIPAVLKVIEGSGMDEVSLSSLALSDYSELPFLAKGLSDRLSPLRVALSLSSLRAYRFPPGVLEAASEVRAAGLTMAPEAGTQRLRNVINKTITEEDILEGAGEVFGRGWTRLKLYFMMGLPGETDEDIEAITALVRKVADEGRRILRGRRPDVVVSVSTFVPKPHTPFQWEGFIDDDSLRRRRAILSKSVHASGLKLKLHDPALSRLETLLSRGDRRMARAIESAFRLGCRFDAWDDMHEPDSWLAALRESSIDIKALHSGIDPDDRLPWDHLDSGVSRAFLLHERDKAIRGETTSSCGRFKDETGERFVCHHCGLRCEAGSRPLVEIRSAPTAREPDQPIRPSPRFKEHGSPFPYRLLYASTGRFALLGHLDQARAMGRTLRRAGLTPLYTQGFHPQPRLNFAPPASLGTWGLGEIVDAVLEGPADPADMIGRLNPKSPEGLGFLAARPLSEGEAGISSILSAAEYLVLVPSPPGAESVRAWIETRISALITAETVLIRRKKSKQINEIDIRPLIFDATLTQAVPSIPPIEGQDWAFAIRFILSAASQRTARIGEVMSWLWEGQDIPCQVCRRGLFAGDPGRFIPAFDPELIPE